MRTLRGIALVAAAVLAGGAGEAGAQDRYVFNQNQTGLALPGVSLPQGFDEVRGADGTSCRSSNTGAGAYADMGVIGGRGENGTMGSGAVYGRVVVPLGSVGTRLDCRKLFDLEIERLQAEVRLLKAGLDTRATGATNAPKGDAKVFTEGWSNEAQAGPAAAAGAQPMPAPARPTVAPPPARSTAAPGPARAPAAAANAALPAPPPPSGKARTASPADPAPPRAPTPAPAKAQAQARAQAPVQEPGPASARTGSVGARVVARSVRQAPPSDDAPASRASALAQPSVFDSALRGSLRP